MQVTLRVRRFNPETDTESRIETYDVLADPMDRVLDLLHWVKWNVDGSLTFRRSCAHGICGSDAMLINGTNRLACKVLVREVGDQITVEPLKGLPVSKDLLVDMEPFFASYREVLPYLVNDDPAPDTERRQSPRAGSASTTPPSASCAPPAPPPARSSGPTASTSARRRSSTPTASSSTCTRAPPSA